MGIGEATAEYRQARPDDDDALLALWTDANPGTLRDDWRRSYARIPDRFARTWVAAGPADRPISVAINSVRWVRDAAGAPRRVGHLSHVATHPSYRGHGHGRRVVALALAAMQADGCAWSSLLTSENARHLYEGLGWRSRARAVRRGLLSVRPEDSSTYSICRFEPGASAGSWDAIRRLYDASNATRPLTIVRDDDWWRTQPGRAESDTFAGHTSLLITAHHQRHSEPCAYLWVFVLEDETAARGAGVEVYFTVAEFGALPTESAALPALFAALPVELDDRRAAGQIHGPREAEIDAAALSLFGKTCIEVEDASFMARPVAVAFDEANLRTILDAPTGVLWPLDDL